MRTAPRLSSRAQRNMSEANGALQTRDPGSPVSRLFRMPGYLGPGSARSREPSGMTIERHRQKPNAISLPLWGRDREGRRGDPLLRDESGIDDALMIRTLRALAEFHDRLTVAGF